MENIKNKSLIMRIDHENGIKIIALNDGDVKKSISISSGDGKKLLDSLGADVILHFDDDNKLVSVELMGL